jgi:hypothetical protein
MTTDERRRWTSLRLLEVLALGLGAWYVLVYITLALVRLRYPFELEWMEGAIVDQVNHVRAGHRLYVAPSIHFIPFQYPPLYFYLGALVSRILGGGFLPLRLLSFLASLGCFGTMFAIVRRESGSARAGLFAVAVFAACFRAAGAWYDLARIDSLCLLLVLTGTYLVRFHDSRQDVMAAAVLLALAFLTKQSAVLIALPLLAYLVIVSWREGLLAAAVFAAVAGGATWMLNAIHHGWYVYYVFMMPARMQQIDPVSVDFWRQDILGPLAIATAMSLGYLAVVVSRAPAAARSWFYPLLGLGMIGSAWLSRLHAGAYDNNLIPAYAVISLLFGLAIAEADIRVYGPALCIVQLLLLFYDPRQQLPAPGSREAGRQLVSVIAATTGDVFLPQHGYLATLGGKRAFAHTMAVYDVMRAGSPADAARLTAQFHRALIGRQFGAVIVDKLDPWFAEDLEHGYRRNGGAIESAGALWTVTGRRTRPEWIYVPR